VLLVQGDGYLGGPALTRIYAVHVILVPILLLALTGYHLYLVILHGTITPLEQVVPVESGHMQKRLYERQAKSEQLGETFHPETSTESGTMAMTVVIAALLLALFAGPRELLPP